MNYLRKFIFGPVQDTKLSPKYNKIYSVKPTNHNLKFMKCFYFKSVARQKQFFIWNIQMTREFSQMWIL